MVWFALIFMALPASAQSGGASSVPSIQQQWQQFTDRLAAIDADQIISQQTLNQFPQSLLLPASQYPDLATFSWQQLKTLYTVHQNCELPAEDPMVQSPAWQQAMQFEWLLCQAGELTSDWNSVLSALHPAGGSYADRYLAYLQGQADQSVVRAFLQEHAGNLTLANPEHPLHEAMASLSSSGKTALFEGYRFYLSNHGQLWRNHPGGIDVLRTEQWEDVADEAGLSVTSLDAQDHQNCVMQYSNLCISPVPERPLWWQAALVLLLVAVPGLALKMLLERRRALKERQFILQLLTHELRTPVTSMGFTVEQFRDEFDHLSGPAQDAFYRLSGDYQRLSRLTAASKGFLSDRQDAMAEGDLALFSDWLDAVTEPYNLSYRLTGDQEIALPYYWLGVCLDNLIRNALIHGEPPVRIEAKITGEKIWIEISDQGQSSPRRLLWRRVASDGGKTEGKTTDHTDGMGIGLMIVRRIMRRLGGKLTEHRQPTRYRLELPR
ncbi:ATP-binding protein [Photobacterium sp. R1]